MADFQGFASFTNYESEIFENYFVDLHKSIIHILSAVSLNSSGDG